MVDLAKLEIETMKKGKVIPLTLRELLDLFDYHELCAISWIRVKQRVDRKLWMECLKEKSPGHVIISPNKVLLNCLGTMHLELYVHGEYVSSIRIYPHSSIENGIEAVACSSFDSYDVAMKHQMEVVRGSKISRFDLQSFAPQESLWQRLRDESKFTLNGVLR